jgi:hypothetical protein
MTNVNSRPATVTGYGHNVRSKAGNARLRHQVDQPKSRSRPSLSEFPESIEAEAQLGVDHPRHLGVVEKLRAAFGMV